MRPLCALAKDFANAIKTGPPSGNNWPNQPGYNAMHRAYNPAVEEVLSHAEATAGDRNTWSLSQWKKVANEILNSEEPEIKGFLDVLEENNPGPKAALGAAISGYSVSVKVAARLIAAGLAEDLMMFTVLLESKSMDAGGSSIKPVALWASQSTKISNPFRRVTQLSGDNENGD